MICINNFKAVMLGLFCVATVGGQQPTSEHPIMKERSLIAGFAGTGSRWNFELRNRSPHDIVLYIRDGLNNKQLFRELLPASESFVKGQLIKKEKTVSVVRLADLDLSHGLYVGIGINQMQSIYWWRIKPDQKQYSTVFLTWENFRLRPQKGSFGKTQSGLPLNKNIKQSSIEKVE